MYPLSFFLWYNEGVGKEILGGAKKMEITTKEELFQVITDLQGQLANMQETIDKLSPVEEVAEEVAEETGQETEALSDEEVSEIDKLLQES